MTQNARVLTGFWVTNALLVVVIVAFAVRPW